jgi:hypothetical protein
MSLPCPASMPRPFLWPIKERPYRVVLCRHHQKEGSATVESATPLFPPFLILLSSRPPLAPSFSVDAAGLSSTRPPPLLRLEWQIETGAITILNQLIKTRTAHEIVPVLVEAIWNWDTRWRNYLFHVISLLIFLVATSTTAGRAANSYRPPAITPRTHLRVRIHLTTRPFPPSQRTYLKLSPGSFFPCLVHLNSKKKRKSEVEIIEYG